MTSRNLLQKKKKKGCLIVCVPSTKSSCIPSISYLLGFPGGSDGKESAFNEGDLGSIPRLGRSPAEGNGYPHQYSGLENSMHRGAWGFPHNSVSKQSTCSSGDLGSIPGLGRSPGEANGNPLQYSSLENSMHRGAWWAAVHGVAKSQTQLSK